MNRILICVFLSAIAASALAAPTIPSDIAQHATELAKSVIALTESAKDNPEIEEFDAAMQALVKKYIDFEQIIAKTYVDLTGKKEDSEEAFKAYYESVDKLWHSALGDKEGKDVTVVELAAAAKHIAQQMVQLIPQLQMTPEHLDQLLAHGEVIFIIADDAHHVVHPERSHHDQINEEVDDANVHKRERRWAHHHGHPQGHWPYNIFWAEHQWGPYGQHWTGHAHHPHHGHWGHWGHGHHGHWGHGW